MNLHSIASSTRSAVTTRLSRAGIAAVLLLYVLCTTVVRADHIEDGASFDSDGTLAVVRIDHFDSRQSEVQYYLQLPSGGRVPLTFDHAPDNARTGDKVHVRGIGHNRGVYVAAANGDGMIVTEAVAAAAVAGGQSTIVMLVNLQNVTVACSVAQVSNTMFGTTYSVDSLYRETSYGNVWFTGNVVGPYTINYSTTPCDGWAWADAADQAATAAGVNLANYTRKVYVLPGGTCIYGSGTIGGNPSYSWIGDCGGNDVYAHELGHNLDMHHSGTDQNNDGVINEEYGDVSDFMGYGAVGWRQINAPHKAQMGWMPQTKITTITAGGIFQVSALELNPASAPFAQAYLINVPGSSESYYLSARRRIGYDTNLSTFYTDRLQIHRYSSGATLTRFISSLGDTDTFADNAIGFEARQTGRTADSTTFTVTFGIGALPSPWLSTTVGGAALGGSATYSGATFSVSGSGNDIWDTSDGFHYVYQSLSGDGEIKARVTAQENTNPWAKSGVMIRESLDGNSKHAMMMVTPANGFNLQYRTTTGGASGWIQGGALNSAPNNWVRVVRSGSTLSAYSSADGASWTLVGSVTIAMSQNVYVGLAVTSHDNNQLNTTTFDNATFIGSPAGTGLVGDYFDNSNFTGTMITRTDATVNFDWGSGSPMAGIAADTFSVRWNGQVQPVYSQTYTFYTTTDDGVRLWVNNQLLIDKWIDQGPTEWSGNITLSAGVKYTIKMEYYENGGGASAKLAWSSPSTPKAIIPQIQLYPPAPSNPPNAPTGLTASSTVKRKINLAWTQSTSPGITQNKVYRSTTGSGGPYTLRATLAPSTSYTDSGLTSGQQYFYVVTAVNSGGESAFSGYAGATAR
jgi:regulation of enolase protein 1 (concanavalin A-like superfamily)